MRFPKLVWSALGLSLCLSPHNALAAPQILAVVAAEAATPLICRDGVCEADLTTYCLQRHRPAPEFGTVYMPADSGAVTLVVTDAEGNQHRLPAEGRVGFVERRGYTAVTAHIAESVLSELGAVGAAIEIAPDASLLPVPQAGDPDPLTADEIEMTVGPLRTVGRKLVDETAEAQAARELGALINRLPRGHGASAEAGKRLWRDLSAGGTADTGHGPGPARARHQVGHCVTAMEAGGEFNLRGCLERRHDNLMRGLNDTYWDAFAGS